VVYTDGCTPTEHNIVVLIMLKNSEGQRSQIHLLVAACKFQINLWSEVKRLTELKWAVSSSAG
jgi:hypothetical protein